MSNTRTLDLQDIINRAVEALQAWCVDNLDSDPTDNGILHEFADGAVPIYNYDLLQLATDLTNGLALTEPEIGPAFDGTPTPINIIAANVYEAVEAELHEEWRRIEEGREETDSDYEEEED